MKSDSAKKYQFVVVYPTSLDEKNQKKELKILTDFVETKEAELSFADWGEKELAYEIEDNNNARFWIGDLKVNEDKPMPWNELKTFLSRNKAIIRYLILKN
jgi:ribosomal protein S6